MARIAPEVERAGATAMKRVELSRPVRLALEAGVVRPSDDVFDYGCGYGTDIEFLRELGHVAAGWDPYHDPHSERTPAAIVNLGYVLNVIEDPNARSQALKEAWALARRALVVSVRTTNELTSIAQAVDHADGVMTGAATFQRLFGQAEAREYVGQVLDADAIPLGIGVFVVFKDPVSEQSWLDQRATLRRRVRRLRRIVEPRPTLRDQAYVAHRELLQPLEEFLAERGRLPDAAEVDWAPGIEDVFGSLPKAFQVIRHVSDRAWWEDAAADRRDELLVRFALARLHRRPRFSALPPGVQRDVKALLGSYKAACQQADGLLFSIGDPMAMREAASTATVGKRTPEAHYVHVDAVDLLPPALRVFIGAAESLVGDVPDATLVKAHLDKPRASFLVYPHFDRDPHPALAESWVVDFRELDVRPRDYRSRDNPPVLHRKELFVAHDHPKRQTFERLTSQEERHGLLQDTNAIGTRDGWTRRLRDSGWELRGHRLVRMAD